MASILGSDNTDLTLNVGGDNDLVLNVNGAEVDRTSNGFGKVLQVVSVSNTAGSNTTSTAFVDTGVEITITPKSSTSKIMVTAVGNHGNSGGGTSGATAFQIVRDATTVTRVDGLAWNDINQNYADRGTFSLSKLDSPATTSAITYRLQFRAWSGTSYINQWKCDTNITLMEIGA